MSEKLHLLLLILCGTFSQGIIATSSDDDTRESSDLLLREKRVINLDHQEQGSLSIREANYMVVIKEKDSKANCAGSILSHYTVITASLCIVLHESMYEVISGATQPQPRSQHHIISSKLTNYGNSPHQHFDGITLITVEPHFILGPKTGSINLYTGHLATGTQVTVNGWGSFYPLIHTLINRRKLRQINVPIMDHRLCENALTPYFTISHKHICTHCERQFCARSDLGAPLVVNNMLAGIHVVKPEIRNNINPEVFIDIQLPEYKAWITRNTRYI